MIPDRCAPCREGSHSFCPQHGSDVDHGCRCLCSVEARLFGLRDAACPPDVKATLDEMIERRNEERRRGARYAREMPYHPVPLAAGTERDPTPSDEPLVAGMSEKDAWTLWKWLAVLLIVAGVLVAFCGCAEGVCRGCGR